jgi:hypothetical protein
MFVDVEPMLSGWLKGATGVQCVTELPATLETAVPLIEVGRIGGSDSQVVIDAATVDVTCWGGTRDTARKLAYLVQDQMRVHLPGSPAPGGVVTFVNTVSGPTWLPYDNTAVRRFHATFQVFVRSH